MKPFDSYILKEESDSRHSEAHEQAGLRFLEELSAPFRNWKHPEQSISQAAIVLGLGLSLAAVIGGRCFFTKELPECRQFLQTTEGAIIESALPCERFAISEISRPSNEFVDIVRQAYDAMPEGLKRFIVEKNLKINIVENLADINRSAQATGLYAAEEIPELFIAERFQHNGIWTTWPEFVPQTLRHEVGHAVDHLLLPGKAWVSDGLEFRMAHLDDVEQMLPKEKEWFPRYSIAGDERSRREVFAELFSYSHGNGVHPLTQRAFEDCFSQMKPLVDSSKTLNIRTDNSALPLMSVEQ